MNIQYDNNQKETTQIRLLVSDEDKQVKLITDDIRKTNKKISEIQKEKEQIRSATLLLKKHIEQLKNKINVETSKSKEFMLNVSKLTRSIISES